ncbi:MAG TPA: secondary thiamine-phosphate synthase enzyme YjbQ [Candidatus Didemnitutus sp.]|jgi:secondary thiamine-phosphate synthase enzyme
MPVHQTRLSVPTHGRGPIEVTGQVASAVARSGCAAGLVSVFCRHTSCSLVLMENADPTAWEDLQGWFDRLVPENDSHFRHTLEGGDDMPGHIKMALTRSSETIPFTQGKLLLGTWQGIFLWEHRRAPHDRELVLTVTGD